MQNKTQFKQTTKTEQDRKIFREFSAFLSFFDDCQKSNYSKVYICSYLK